MLTFAKALEQVEKMSPTPTDAHVNTPEWKAASPAAPSPKRRRHAFQRQGDRPVPQAPVLRT